MKKRGGNVSNEMWSLEQHNHHMGKKSKRELGG